MPTEISGRNYDVSPKIRDLITSKLSKVEERLFDDVIDVRVTRVDYTEAITESVYRRMEAERRRVANELRSTGAAGPAALVVAATTEPARPLTASSRTLTSTRQHSPPKRRRVAR